MLLARFFHFVAARLLADLRLGASPLLTHLRRETSPVLTLGRETGSANTARHKVREKNVNIAQVGWTHRESKLSELLESSDSLTSCTISGTASLGAELIALRFSVAFSFLVCGSSALAGSGVPLRCLAMKMGITQY